MPPSLPRPHQPALQQVVEEAHGQAQRTPHAHLSCKPAQTAAKQTGNLSSQTTPAQHAEIAPATNPKTRVWFATKRLIQRAFPAVFGPIFTNGFAASTSPTATWPTRMPLFGARHAANQALPGVLAGVLLLTATAPAAQAQTGPTLPSLPAGDSDLPADTTSAFEHRPIHQVRYEGLVRVGKQLVDNVTRVRAGDTYERATVEADIERLTRLDRFRYVGANVELNADNTVNIVYQFDELPILAAVQIIGSQAFSIQELEQLVLLRTGDPVDENLIHDAIRRIKDKYEEEGYFVADVEYDEQLLEEADTLILQVHDGPKVRVEAIEFVGNTVFPDDELQKQIKTKTHIWVLRNGGLQKDLLDIDDAAVRQYYKDRGYLDARVGSSPLISNNQRNAVVRFQVEEGPQYVVDKITINGLDRLSPQQMKMHMAMQSGMVFNQAKIDESIETIRSLYAQLGYLDTKVQAQAPRFHAAGNQVDLVFDVNEGIRSRVGKLLIRGNEITQDKVILQRVRRIKPGRYFDQTGVEETQRLLRESGLFSQSTVTILGQPTDEYRDVVIEVQETQTGSILFSAGVSSDAGLIGGINVNQRNFDILDWPNTTDELLTQRAFRGGGQNFNIALEPGTRTSRYAISLREPHIFDTDYSLGGSLQFYERLRETHDEARNSVALSTGKQFGDVYSASVSAVLQKIKISDIDADAPVDIFDVAGTSDSDTLGFVLVRNTTDSNIFPTKGSRTRVGVEQFGLLYGDYDFTRLSASYDRFWTVDRDYLDRPSVFRWEVDAGHILQDNQAPVFDRLYAGGHSSFRGFDHRGVGPRGIRNDNGQLGDDPIGGDWQFLTTFEYNFPIDPSGNDVLRAVIFSDMGTVQDEIGFDEWRVSIGTGLRIKLPFFGQAPFALDFAIPLQKEEGDETRVLSFDLSLPFN